MSKIKVTTPVTSVALTLKSSSERTRAYQRLEIDTNRLQLYYIDRAKTLLKCLKDYTDSYATELKEVLKSFIKEPINDLADLIDNIKNSQFYNSFGINDTLFDIFYPDNELIEFVLTNNTDNLISKTA